MSEQQFIRSTAPTLAGIKTGSLFPYRYESKARAIEALRRYNRQLTPKGLRLLPLRMTDCFAMLYLYRPGRLGADLRNRDAVALLRQAGYPDCDEAGCLRELRRRLAGNDAFPHEIGLFLSYPPEDVPAMPDLLSFAAGAMLYVVVEELIPDMALGRHSHVGVMMFALGFSLMMALDVALG